MDPASLKASVDIATNKTVQEFLGQVWSGLKKAISSIASGPIPELEAALGPYLRAAYARFSRLRTLVFSDCSVELAAHYEPVRIQQGANPEIPGEMVLDALLGARASVVVGTAGTGKSVLLRHLFTRLINDRCQCVPILIELRTLQLSESPIDLVGAVQMALAEYSPPVPREQVELAIRAGSLMVLLDGFDEVQYDHRGDLEAAIISAARRFQKCPIVLTSRPDPRFDAWEEFPQFRVLPLSLEQAVNLVERIQIEPAVKGTFIEQLKERLYQRYEAFASTPLLLTMMLLTFNRVADISEKLHVFYEQAFEVLFHRHDALKLYKRQNHSGLPIDEFRRVLAAFSVLTHQAGRYSFSREEALDSIRDAIRIQKIEVDPSSFFLDLVESVCVLQADGTIYLFTHRSFQEYFCAVFVSELDSELAHQLLWRLLLYGSVMGVLHLLSSMNPQRLDEIWVHPRLAALSNDLSKWSAEDEPLDVLRYFFGVLILVLQRGPDESREVVCSYNFSTHVPYVLLDHLWQFSGMRPPALYMSVGDEIERMYGPIMDEAGQTEIRRPLLPGPLDGVDHEASVRIAQAFKGAIESALEQVVGRRSQRVASIRDLLLQA